MVSSREIQCITRRPGRHDPHESIRGFGGMYDGQYWWLDEATVIKSIEEGICSFRVKASGRTCRVVVASDGGSPSRLAWAGSRTDLIAYGVEEQPFICSLNGTDLRGAAQ